MDSKDIAIYMDTIAGCSLTFQERESTSSWDTVQAVAVKIVETILKVGTEISEPQQVDMLLDFIAPLVADVPGLQADEDDEVCIIQQHQASRMHNVAVVWQLT